MAILVIKPNNRNIIYLNTDNVIMYDVLPYEGPQGVHCVIHCLERRDIWLTKEGFEKYVLPYLEQTL